MNKTPSIQFPHPPGAGGPGSFQIRFEKELKQNGWQVTYAKQSKNPDLIFVVGGTRKLLWLWQMRLKGIPILYRLDGIVWLHKKQKVGIKKYISTEIRNYTSKIIHAFLAHKIVYQSQFVKKWWDKDGLRNRKNNTIIHNGVSTDDNPRDIANHTNPKKRLVILEGVVDYSPYAIRLLNDLAIYLHKEIEIEIYGKFQDTHLKKQLHKRLQYHGYVKREEVPAIMKGSVYLSLDINPACPNTVIEALSCAAPVVAFDTGSIPELIDNKCGIVVPYGANPWDLAYPNVKALSDAIQTVFKDYSRYASNAYHKANQKYSIDKMFQAYKTVIIDTIKNVKK